MTAALTPALALAYLQELSVDVREAVVLDAAGDPLVGARTLAPAARRLLAATDAPVVSEDRLLLARTPDGGAIAALAGDLALVALLEHDLARVAEALVTASP
jgi:hypothetical protein